MRSSAIRLAIAGLASSLLWAAPALAGCADDGTPWDTTVWFFDRAVGPFEQANLWFRFMNPPPWPAPMCAWPTLPEPGESTYIPAASTAIVSSGSDVRAGQTYVGGWDQLFDGLRGSPPRPLAPAASLVIHGGSLQLDHCARPPLNLECYLRIGYRGAAGIVEQRGGGVGVPGSVTVAMGSAKSHGIYLMSGGNLQTSVLDVGVQGTGVFYLSGGTVRTTCCLSSVGLGYEYPGQVGPGPIPGNGQIVQSGGRMYLPGGVRLGVQRFSIGQLHWSGNAEFVTGRIQGGQGRARLVQQGGAVTVRGQIMLGEKPGSSGRFEISGGTLLLEESGSSYVDGVWLPNGLYVGYGGRGTLAVVGSDAEIAIRGVYRQRSGSRLRVELGPAAPHVSPIQVAGTAAFESGAELAVDLLDYAPGMAQTFTLLTAYRIAGPLPMLVDVPGPGWSVGYQGTPPRALVVSYTPQ